MTTTIEFFVPHLVRPKNKKKAFRFGDKIRLVNNPKQAANADSLIALCAQHRPEKPIEGALRVTYRFCFPWRKTDSAKRRALNSIPHDVRPDLGNLTKQMDDVLKNCGFIADDGQIADYGGTCKVWTDSPGVNVKIEPFETKG